METSCVWWLRCIAFCGMADKIRFFHLLVSDGNPTNQYKFGIYEFLISFLEPE